MSNAGLGLRDSSQSRLDDDFYALAARARRLSGENETKALRSAPAVERPKAEHRARTAISPRTPRAYDSGRTRIEPGSGVRTVKIRGQATPPRRRPAVPVARYDQHPDRAAQWALFLGVFMVVVAIVTGAQ